MTGKSRPLATVAGWFSSVSKLGEERTRARCCPSSASSWMSSAKFEASQPIPREKGFDPASAPTSGAGKKAAVEGRTPPASVGATVPAAVPRMSTMGEFEPVRGVHAPPQITPRDRASIRTISTSRASMRTDGAARSTLSMNSRILTNSRAYRAR